MNYVVIIIIGIACLILGWFLGYNHANEQLSKIEEALDYIEETNRTITVESVQYANAESEIRLLEKIESGNNDLAVEQIIESLASSYHLSVEAIEDGMASENDKDIVRSIEKLSTKSILFKKVMEYED